MLSRREFGWLTLAWFIWRSVLMLVAVVADRFLKYEPTFPYAFTLLPKYDLPRWLYSWANFDGVHYLTIAEKGYIGTGLIQAFFPVYPGLVAALNTITANTLLSGLIVANVASLVLVWVWFGFVKAWKGSAVAIWATAILAVFPTSFYFGAVYSESLFLLLVIGAFWAAQRQQWWLAGAVVAVAAATRVVGVGLVPCLLLWWWQSRDAKLPRQWWQVVPIIGGVVGLGLYMWFLYREFHDPLYFFHVQSEFGSGRQESLILYPQVVWRYIKIWLTYQPHDWKYLAFIQEGVVGVMGLVGLVWAARRVPLAWTLFGLGAFLLPTVTGTFSSMPRYVLVCFPIWLALAEQFTTHRWLRVGYLLGSLSILILMTVLFVQGYWVA